MFKETGIPSPDMVLKRFPPMERINKGPVAVAECYERIPCNPCQRACKFGAIRVGDDINNLPVLDYEACTGCGLCVSRCPGLAIMIVDGSKNSSTVEMRVPYEFLPLPKPGEEVWALDRAGKRIGKVKVVKVMNPGSFDRTPIIAAEVDRALIYAFRNISVEDSANGR